LALLVATAIAVPLLLPKHPTATLLEQSNLRLDGLGTGSVLIDLRMKVDNPNRYAIAFQNLRLGTFWVWRERRGGGRDWRKYPACLLFTNLPSLPPPLFHVDEYDFNGAHIGEVTRQECLRAPGRSSGLMNATAFMQPSFLLTLPPSLPPPLPPSFPQIRRVRLQRRPHW
jgi:hypothetical protein